MASLSPLLTFAWLWQLKEWRGYRLLEHLRRAGWFGQLLGKVRPAIILIYGAGLWAAPGESPVIVTLMLLAGLAFAQVALGRQRRPVFTRKAILITGTALILDAALALFVATHHLFFLPVLTLLQPLMVTVGWLGWYPVDVFLKQRIIARARMLREKNPEMTVIGITGSVGKTTTKELLACVLKDLQPLVTPAHVNSEIGVAQWMIQKLSPPLPRRGEGAGGWGCLIIEMGAYRKGEIALMCSYAKPSMGVITHVGMQHIGLFGSQEAVFQAKSELVRALPASGRAFVNGDNELCRNMIPLSKAPVTVVATGGSADIEAFDIEETPRGVRFRLVGRSFSEGRVLDTVFEVPLSGTHNVTNILLALAVGQSLGITPERMALHLRSFTPMSKTFEVRMQEGVRILDDTHNSSPASLRAATAWARVQPEKQKTLLASGLIEMGEFQESAERELGALGGQVFDRIIVMDETSRRHFSAGAGRPLEGLTRHTLPVAPGSLLVCAGRMSDSVVNAFIPERTGVTP